MSRGAARSAVLAVVLGLCALLQVGWAALAATGSPTSLSALVVKVLGPGYSVISEGPVAAGALATSSPNPAGAASALSTLTHSKSITTYQRIWSDTSANNEIQDLVVGFATTATAKTFFTAAQHALASGEIVSSAPLSQPPGAFRTTYFATTTTQIGVGQAIAMRSSTYVAIISFFSSNAPSNTQPISLADGQLVADDQYVALARAESSPPTTKHPAKRSSALAWIGSGVAVVLGIALMLWVLRRSSTPITPSVILPPQPAAPPERAEPPPAPPPTNTPAGHAPQLDDLLLVAAVDVPPAPTESAPTHTSTPVTHPEPEPSHDRLGRAVVPATASAVVAFVVVRILRRRSGSGR